MIFTLFKKELKDTLRDRRTLIMMMVIPILIFPLVLNLFVGISSKFQEEAANKKVKIGIVGPRENFVEKELNAIPEVFGEKEIIHYKDTLTLKDAIQKDTIQFGVFLDSPLTFDEEAKNFSVPVYFNAVEIGMQDRAESYLNIVQRKAETLRYKQLHIEQASLQPLQFSYHNVASDKEMIGKLAGGILPYIFIAFGFIGCMYPAIDLFTGEKERGTIETLLTTPVKRWQILFGKMGVVVLSGLVAAACALLGLYLSIEVFDLVKDPELLGVIRSILAPSFIISMFALLFPLTIFFAGVMVPISVYAKTFKEAQSIITPMNIIMVLPAMVGFFPGIELNVVTACIPVVNVVLATKDLIAETLDYSLLALSFVVMIALAVLAVLISYRQFDKESNVVV